MSQHYRTYNDMLKQRFGVRVAKVTLDAGFTCPNIDGSKGVGGCTFCDETGSSSRVQKKRDSITEQIHKAIPWMQRRFQAEKFIAYFQSNTNTYAPVEQLKPLYDAAISAHPDIIGLSISTRPDCVDEAKLKLIASYQEKVPYVCVEYGMQTIHDKSLAWMNRCETHADFLAAFTLTRQFNLEHTIHVVLGLPTESHAEQMATADQLRALKVDGVKIHLLVAMEKTPLAEQYIRGEWQPYEQDEYIELACDFMERLHPDTVIHRVAGNGHPLHVVAPRWLQEEKVNLMQAIDDTFAQRGTRQGRQAGLVERILN